MPFRWASTLVVLATWYVLMKPSALLTVMEVALTAVTEPRWVSTVWCPRLVGSWLKPRAAYPDDWEAPPAEEKNLQAAGWYYMSLLRTLVEAGRPFVPPP